MFNIGDKLTAENYTQGAIWCNENGFVINSDTWIIEEQPKPSDEELKQIEINALKKQLDDTDYKIIKCSEYSLAGKELPYNIEYLHSQRQAIRDRITELEG